MKRIIISIIAIIIASVSASAQSVNWRDIIMSRATPHLWAEFNINTVNKIYDRTAAYPLSETNGYCVIKNCKNTRMGLLLYHDALDENAFYAYDLECPRCKDHGVKHAIHMVTYLIARCERCHSEYSGISNGAGTQVNKEQRYSLITYCVYVKGNKILVTDI